MHRVDNSKYLLFIEPPISTKSLLPLNDEITITIQKALDEATKGVSRYSDIQDCGTFQENNSWRGIHLTACNTASSNCDYLLKNGMITNSLCVFYLQYYRDWIPKDEMNKVLQVVDYYQQNS